MIEVRVREANGSAVSAFSDADGNFFVLRGAAAGALVPPAHPGARDGTTTQLMQDVINDADCNSCHRNGGQGPLHLP